MATLRTTLWRPKLWARLRGRSWLALACVALAVAHFTGALRPVDNGLAALRAGVLERDASGSVVVVEIDTRSLRSAGEWPWPRARFAQALRHLREAGVTLVGLDVDFSVRSEAAQDSELRAAIDADPGAVVLPTFLQANGDENFPLASISENAVVASVNVPLDADGRVRRYYRGYAHDGSYRPTLAATMAGAAYGDHSAFLIDYGVRVDSIDRISFEDVHSGAFDPERVRGRAVMIGATALELGDEFATPVLPAMPGVLVHALAFENLVQGRTLTKPSGALMLALALVVLISLWPRRGALDLRRACIRQSAVLSVALVGPLALQAIAPVSAGTGLILLAQALCILASVNQELKRRAEEIVRQREEHLQFVASHDPETELPNRRAMLEELERQLEQGEEARFVVVVAIGIERFATLRGAVGYGAANRAVRALADQLRAQIRQADAYHLSTAVLGVILTVPDAAAAKDFAADVLTTLRHSVEVDGQPLHLSLCAGATYAESGEGVAEQLLEQASLALDQAKLQRRSLVMYSTTDFPDPKLQLALVSDMHAGIDRGEFRLVYQAKASARDGAIVGAEALMRWRHPIHGEVAPDSFILAAEETGAIEPMTRWLIKQVANDSRKLRAEGLDFPLSINVSARSVSDVAFTDFLLAEARAEGASLCLEITETAFIEDPIAAKEAIAAFQEAGHLVAIDDYGVGLSSLAYLKQMPVDELKLDKSLIKDLGVGKRDRLILKSTIDLAHALGMSVVAEGVESTETLGVLQGLSCDYIQGFLIAKPAPLQELIQLCQREEVELQRTGN